MRKSFLCCFCITLFSSLYAQTAYFPFITELSFQNHIFLQYCEDVLQGRKALAASTAITALPIHFYRYKANKEDTIIKIAARCSIPYDALVTLNAIESVKTDITGKILILPTLPGLYLPEHPTTDIGKLTEAFCKTLETEYITFKLPVSENGEKKTFICYPNVLLDGTARSFFFTPFYRFPLDSIIITSPFGMRKSPFTGKPTYHAGIDLAAPTGSPVYACTSGQITEISYSHIYGNYIILTHDDGRQSLYGHLSAVTGRLYQNVKSGTIIGKVGSTGLSTGPHLHFEVRERGKAKDPSLFINTKQ